MGASGDMGVVPRHVHMHALTCVHVGHDNFMQMAAPLVFGIPGNSL